MVYLLYSLLNWLRRQGNQNTPPPNHQLSLIELIPDEVLLEIFTRLRDEWSLIQCTAVSKRWSSLISHNIQHLLSSTTVLFRFSHRKSSSFHALSLVRSSIEALDLKFLPFWPHEEVKASAHDMLLVSQVGTANYLVCNPHTRRWTPLPKIPKLLRFRSDVGHGLVLGPKKDSFGVVILRSSNYDSLLIFRSETGQWSSTSLPGKVTSSISYARQSLDLVTTASGTVHWLDGTIEYFKGIAAHNPRTNKSNFVGLPLEDLGGGIGIRRPSKDKIMLGVVNGRLRLSHVVKSLPQPSSTSTVNKATRSLKIWELEGDCTEHQSSLWKLVHNVTLQQAKDMGFVLAMHPRNGDVVFVVCDGEIFSLDLGQDQYIKIDKFPCEREDLKRVMNKVALSIKVFTHAHFMHPLPCPQLPPI